MLVQRETGLIPPQMRCGALLRLDGRGRPSPHEHEQSSLDHEEWRRFLLSVGRGSGGQVAEHSEEAGGGLLVGEGFEVDGGGEVRGLGAEADAQQVVSARCHQRIDYRGDFPLPLGTTGKHDGAGRNDCPVARLSD